ncbi:hypothetical protein [Nostoc sp. UHCC 0870]|uniref:hypothetical protein n=1 Tax=Nostoc sp. UHCC 0870 TaxID=2914041 RepID=UPI001EDF5E24|nr:hypothetical protein [Nostoc sp. UHCC 0870]UKP00147.1 hypothetical protein L6494_10800 [Nostoc sp. UHCC 0870]
MRYKNPTPNPLPASKEGANNLLFPFSSCLPISHSAPAKRRATANSTQHSALSTQHSALSTQHSKLLADVDAK